MSAPSISLIPGQSVVTPLTSEAATINGTGILSGEIVQTYSLVGYIVGDLISFHSKSSFSFTNDDPDTPYVLVYDDDILFKVILPP